jgi:hypothetical protein
VHHAAAPVHETVAATHHSPVVHAGHTVTHTVAPAHHETVYDSRYEAPVIRHSAYAEEEPGYDYGDEYGSHSYGSYDEYPYEYADYGADGHEGARVPVEESHHTVGRLEWSEHDGDYPITADVEYRYPLEQKSYYTDEYPATHHSTGEEDWREVHDWSLDHYGTADHEYPGHYTTGIFYQ